MGAGVTGAIVEVEGLTKTYRKRASKERVTAARDISFRVEGGEILGLLGPNGAGKTTTIKMICSLLKPDAGRVRVKGIDNQRGRLKALRHLSAVLEGNLYWRLSVRENMLYFAGNRGVSARAARPKIGALLERFGLGDKADELVNNLSRGTQQKLALAVALLADTEVILLDEPTLGLDVRTGLEVRGLLREIAAEAARSSSRRTTWRWCKNFARAPSSSARGGWSRTKRWRTCSGSSKRAATG